MSFRILGVNGGVRTSGPSGRALQLALEILGKHGAHSETFDIAVLPIRDGREDEPYPPSVSAWRAACMAADGLVITVPTIHGGMPGGLKNALDYLRDDQLGGKPFALVGISAGDAEPAVADTARALRHIGAIAAVPDVVISRATQHWGDGERPANVAVAIAIEKIVGDLLALCRLRSEGRLPEP